jgi:thiol:disulfide interchange protein DsbD
MIDPIAVSVDAVAHGNIARIPLVMFAGLMTSVGPCVAPRYIALAGVLTGPRRAITVGLFVAGLLLAYAALGFGAGILQMLAGYAAAIDLLLAALLGIAGLTTLIRDPEHAHRCDQHAGQTRRASAVFTLGAASALVVSPCCTPVVAAVVGLSAFDASPLSRAALLAAFALGHAAPLFFLGAGGSLITTRLQRWSSGSAPAVISGALMLALGLYYGLLV